MRKVSIFGRSLRFQGEFTQAIARHHIYTKGQFSIHLLACFWTAGGNPHRLEREDQVNLELWDSNATHYTTVPPCSLCNMLKMRKVTRSFQTNKLFCSKVLVHAKCIWSFRTWSQWVFEMLDVVIAIIIKHYEYQLIAPLRASEAFSLHSWWRTFVQFLWKLHCS